MSLLISLENATDRALCGGKGANLARVISRGFLVPKGAVVPTTEFDRHIEACRLGKDHDPGALAAGILAQPVHSELVSSTSSPCADGSTAQAGLREWRDSMRVPRAMRSIVSAISAGWPCRLRILRSTSRNRSVEMRLGRAVPMPAMCASRIPLNLFPEYHYASRKPISVDRGTCRPGY